MLQQFVESLPHGSGIDGDWHWFIRKNVVTFANSYHCMMDGIYDGWVNFWISVNKDALLAGNYADIAQTFVLLFLDEPSKELAKRYFLREYLEDTFAEFFRGL